MRQDITFAKEGSRVVQIITKTDDEGVVQRENKINLGEQAAALADMEEKLAEAVKERDGVSGAGAETPVPPVGQNGRTKDWFLRGAYVYQREVQRVQGGVPHHVRIQNMGLHARVVEHVTERANELLAYRDGIRDAQ